MRSSDWSSDVCAANLFVGQPAQLTLSEECAPAAEMREADRKSLRRRRDGLEGIDQRLAKACKEVLIDVTIKRQDKTLLPGCLAFTEIDVDAVKNYDTASKLLRKIAFEYDNEKAAPRRIPPPE